MAFSDGSMWYDLANVPGVLDWIAFVLGTLGIGFTVIQLLRSRSALKAAELALIETRDILIQNQLGSVLPGFEEISNSINASLAADVKDRWQVEAGFGRFVSHGHEAIALLSDSTSDFASLIRSIETSIRLVSKARSSIFTDTTTPLEELVGEAATSVRDLAPKLKGAAVSIRNDPGKKKPNA